MFLEGKNTVNISPCPEIAVEPIPPDNVIKVELFVLNEVVDEPVLNETIAYPQQILEVIDKEKIAVQISTYKELKQYLLDTK